MIVFIKVLHIMSPIPIFNKLTETIADRVEAKIQPFVDQVEEAATTIKQVSHQVEPWAVTNEDGLKIASIDSTGAISTKAVKIDGLGADHSSWSSHYSDNPLVSALTITDLDGLIIASFDPSGSKVPGFSPSTDIPTTGEIFAISNNLTTMVPTGDSIVEQNSIARTLYDMNRKADFGPLNWADFFLGGHLVIPHNAGVGGETTAAIRARHSAEVLAYAPSYNLVHCGINSITSTNPVYSVAEITADLQAMYEANLAAGINTLALTVLPLFTGHPSQSNAVFSKICAVNDWIRAYVKSNRGIRIADTFAKVVNSTSPTGAARQYYLQTDDNIHPSVLGAFVMGKCIAEAIRTDIKITDFLPSSVADRWGLTNSGKQLLDNPLFTGAGGTNTAGTTFTGTVPDGWRIGKAGTWGVGMVTGSVVPNPDGFGNDWIITVTNTGAVGDTLTIIYDDVNNNRVVSGDELYTACQFSASNLVKFMGSRLQVSTTGGSTTNIGSTMEYTAQQPTTGTPQNWTSDLYPQTDFNGVMVTGKAEVPPGTITGTRPSITLRFDGTGAAGVFRISRFGMWKD
jgi:lysophospholipase L1-like esterase